MFSLFIIKIKNLIVFLISILIIILLKFQKTTTHLHTLLLIRLDEIGDFVLFCNFISAVKASQKYQAYRISLCGNELWRDLAEHFFRHEIHSFIWIQKTKFYSNLFYKYRILKQIYQAGFEVVINSRYSRGILYDDLIVRASRAPITIGSEGSLEKHAQWKRHLFTDRYYTRLIPQSGEVNFEFLRNKYFFEKILEEPISLRKPALKQIKEIPFQLPERYIILFPGAGEIKREWAVEKFAQLGKFILQKYNIPIVLCGSPKDLEKSQQIDKILNNNNTYNLAGKTSLPELISIIANSELLISNDTSAPHITAAVNRPFICISNGKTLGRFSPYPKEVFAGSSYIYPPQIMNNLHEMDKLKEQYQFDSDLAINEITVDQVKILVAEILEKKLKGYTF
ncbi:MAG: glycosyltransferase family 9 protein [bacterium]|nr:MAG: glycosyltransferase family 9 protein [bacterium]